MSYRLLGRLGAFAMTTLVYAFTGCSPSPTASSVPPTTHPIRMVINDTAYRFEPSEVVARAGDRLRFENVSGGPHSVAFYADSLTETVVLLLGEALGTEQLGPLMSRLLVDPAEILEMAIPALPPGRYAFTCLPHMAMSMNAVLIVVH